MTSVITTMIVIVIVIVLYAWAGDYQFNMQQEAKSGGIVEVYLVK